MINTRCASTWSPNTNQLQLKVLSNAENRAWYFYRILFCNGIPIVWTVSRNIGNRSLQAMIWFNHKWCKVKKLNFMACIIQGDFYTAREKYPYSSWKQIWPTFILTQVLETVQLHFHKNLPIFQEVFTMWIWALFWHTCIFNGKMNLHGKYCILLF